MPVTIVGHGPSILLGLGAVIDSHPVVRLKELPPGKDYANWGKRTDFICARSHVYNNTEKDKPPLPFWHFEDGSQWAVYYRKYSRRKPSTGLCAVFCAVERGYDEIGLIGFDRILNPKDECTGKWHQPRHFAKWPHDQQAEHDCLYSLGVKIIDLAREHGTVS